MADDPARPSLFSPEKAARRRLSIVILVTTILAAAAGTFLYLVPGASDRDLFVGLIVLLAALGGGQAYLLYQARAQKRPKALSEEYLLADEAPVLEEEVYDVECGRCKTHFRVTDHLQRPLLALCPVCGAEGIVPLRAGSRHATLEIVASGSLPPSTRVIRLRCPRCATINAVADGGERPLRATCTGCAAQIGVR